jgi:hypothetical protein
MKNETKVKIKAVLDAAKVVADMRSPSVEKLLRGYGYDYEADQIKKLVEASDSLNSIR